jgi:formate/nitrite transporter FocA (FNT family)
MLKTGAKGFAATFATGFFATLVFLVCAVAPMAARQQAKARDIFFIVILFVKDSVSDYMYLAASMTTVPILVIVQNPRLKNKHPVEVLYFIFYVLIGD